MSQAYILTGELPEFDNLYIDALAITKRDKFDALTDSGLLDRIMAGEVHENASI